MIYYLNSADCITYLFIYFKTRVKMIEIIFFSLILYFYFSWFRLYIGTRLNLMMIETKCKESNFIKRISHFRLSRDKNNWSSL